MPAWNITSGGTSRIREDSNRKFEPFRLVHCHHPNAFGALLDDWCFCRLPGFRIGIHAFHESPENMTSDFFRQQRNALNTKFLAGPLRCPK